ncbi:MAG TPA: hypothetical protein VE344_04135 [Methylomirabilota bacterium]|nr:hypothetical protein [Methylomirabilota bacterium]
MEQITNFIFLTQKLPKIPIRICIGGSDRETETYAYQIRCMFNSANFLTNDDCGLFGIKRNLAFRSVTPIGRASDSESDIEFITSNTNFSGTIIFPIVYSKTVNGVEIPFPDDPSNTEEIYQDIRSVFQQMKIDKKYTYMLDTNGYFIKPGEYGFLINPK